MTKSVFSPIVVVFAALALCFVSTPATAEDVDVIVFGGIQNAGRLTFQSSPGAASNLIQNFDPKTFGVFGGRVAHGEVIGGEHTIAYAPNFIDTTSNALIYHSNFFIQAPLPVFKPYGTAGIGLVRSGGSSPAAFGTKFAMNYGGGVKIIVGAIGVNMDLRGYAVPKVSISGFTTQDRLDFVQATAGLVFHF